MTEVLGSTVQALPSVRAFVSLTRDLAGKETMTVRGVRGSLDAFLMSALVQETPFQIAFIARDRGTAVRVMDDLVLLLGSGVVSHFGASEERSPLADKSHKVEDAESLQSLINGSARILVTSPDALRSRLPLPASLARYLLTLKLGAVQPIEDLVRLLDENGFERKDFIESVGNYALRGGILDVFPYVGEHPVRIEFNGDVIDSLREFDPLSQRSIKELTSANIVPDLLRDDGQKRDGSLLDYLSAEAVIVLDEPDLQRQGIADALPWSADDLNLALSGFRRQIFSEQSPSTGKEISIGSIPQPAFNGSTRFLKEHLHGLHREGWTVVLGCDGQAEMKRLKELLQEAGDGEGDGLEAIRLVPHTIHEGFEIPGESYACLTEHQIFGRRKRVGGRRIARKKGLTQQEIQQLRREDFVVHADYGIGMFDGLKTITVRGIHHEVLKITYEGGDTLYVNLHYVNRVQKYSSKEGHVPRLNKLGSAEWQKLKTRAKGRIKDIARDLIRLYSERKNSAGYAFQPDTPWQKELEASFVFEDTFDQAKATLEVKADMESSFPMDRLICGDVGFGKTEVAVRAAFKAVMDGKQVAVLVPTTILAIQHFNTFSDRLARYSVRVEAISRLRSKADQSAILRKVSEGGVDILIGTHRLLSKDVSFKDLGLLVVDEEHRFGVSAKEKLRQKKAVVDTLTLTATPIPRTLHFSLMGARDLSVIATPPRNRLSIMTEIIEFNEETLRDAALREIQRGGQVYVVHDRVQDIADFTGQFSRLVPGARTGFAHGQMNPRELEEVMVNFLSRKLDILVCTKIIESGLDIPNVNTIVINRADRFGMAELYQLRGRVGRSNLQAFAYLVAPPLSSLSRESLRRLSAMKEFTELGAGFNLAMRDLEIRGAGNLLGSEQSGYITDMGFETYTRILEEAVAELKEEEFRGMFERSKRPSPEDTQIDVDVDALIPAAYIDSSALRLEVYRRLYGVTSREQVTEIGEELRDRFGPLPTEAQNLLDVLLLRLAAANLGCQRVRILSDSVEIEIAPDLQTWNDEKASSFVSAVAAIREPAVKVLDLNKGIRIRVAMDSTNGTLARARQTLLAVTPLLTTLTTGLTGPS